MQTVEHNTVKLALENTDATTATHTATCLLEETHASKAPDTAWDKWHQHQHEQQVKRHRGRAKQIATRRKRRAKARAARQARRRK